jgi:hypothetical protein
VQAGVHEARRVPGCVVANIGGQRPDARPV